MTIRLLLTSHLCFAIPIHVSSNQENSRRVELVGAFPALNFSRPVFLTHSGDGSNRIFVVEQAGRIRVFANDPQATDAAEFMNISARVNDSGNEMGLLGLAFHPEFSSNGFFYVNYTTGSGSQRKTVISRFSVSNEDSNQGDPNSEFVLLELPQFASNHNGGMLAFGPDGFLFIATGDGGGAGDPQNNGQDLSTLLGKILRIDVDTSQGGLDYGIPSDNPFIESTQDVREEIWAYGFRNPWRFSFDVPTGQLWAGDVGQGSREEIDLVEKGQNYGWRIMEGTNCFNASSCDRNGLVEPIVEYTHNLGCAVTGGYVYRGSSRPDLTGAYVYGDYCSGRIWLLRYEQGQVTADSLLLNTDLSISSFGIDQDDELYILNLSGGTIHRFLEDPATTVDGPFAAGPLQFTLEQNFPNPFNPATKIAYTLARPAHVKLTVFSLLGTPVRFLVQDRQQAGSYRVTWDGRNSRGEPVASGVYYYKIQTDSFVQTRKMLLIK